MKDSFNRDITYLRLSVTEFCNLRCRYCMPADGICPRRHEDMLTEEEMISAVSAAASLGIRKVRITGGEPLVKKNILSICRNIAQIPGIREVCLTTNGTLLSDFAVPLQEAGVSRLNISLDTLDPKKYASMTRTGSLDDALFGIEAALAAGFRKVKINTVLIGGFNDDEIEELAKLTLFYPLDVRFIELMPMYDSGEFGQNAMISGETILEKLSAYDLTKLGNDGVSRSYRLPKAYGNVGIISPVSHDFCDRCSRIRLTADGHLLPCLHGGQEILIKGLSEEEMKARIQQAILAKPARHEELSAGHRSQAGRNMNRIGG